MQHSLNHVFRLVWSHRLGSWCVAPEITRGKGKTKHSTQGQPPAARCVPLLLLLGSTASWAELPQDGQVSAGQGQLNYQDNTLQVQQHSDKLALDWQSFSVGKDNKVVFNQPDAQSVALNRVLGSDVSRIQGAIKANGQVFLLNPNGVLFSPTAQVNTGGLVASTLELSNDDFMAGHFQFEGDSSAEVTNQGEINVAEGGTIALIAATIVNEGSLQATSGNVLIGAGRKVTLDMGGPVKLRVDEGALNTLIEQGGAIRADGGKVLLTARAAGELATSVINHTGITRAQTLSTGENGEIVLLGDMQQGQLQVAGTLDASAPATTGPNGDGGFIETSAAKVQINNSVQVTTLAENGNTGEWLIDPTDFYITAGSATKTDSGIGASTLSAQLAGSNITIETVDAGSEAGDIYVNAPVSWNADTTLSLNADNNILINAPITVENSGGGVALTYGGSHYQVNAPISFTAGSGGAFSVNDQNFTLIHSIAQLQNINTALDGHYALATDIDASETQNWNSSAGFNPVGYYSSLTTDPENGFTGTMEGLGHFISDLTINRPSETDVGLFRFIDTSAAIRNVGLIDAKVNGVFTVGGLVAYNNGRISQSYARGSVSGTLRDEADPVETPADAFSGMHVGGLVGRNNGSISQSYSSGEVTGAYSIGGLVGQNQRNGSISQSYSDSLVSGPSVIGGLAGTNLGSITQSYATGTVTGEQFLGGLAGSNSGTVLQSYATGTVTGEKYVGGLMGDNWGTISQSYATGVINGTEQVGGLVGYLAFSSEITQSYATGAVTGQQYVGGLVGGNSNERELTNYATGETETNPDFGGDIIQSYATGTVTGTNHVGGLVGFNDGVITQSYATGTVTGDEHIGGLVGSNEYSSPFGDDISITQSYATGAASGVKNVGGLVGQNNSGITEQSYATGAISGQSFVGGLVGINRAQATLNHSHASGMVNGSVGNLVGFGFLITINDSSMKTLDELKQLDSFSNWDIDAEGGTDSVWRLYEGYTPPLLRSFLRPLEVNAQDTTVTYNGSEQSGSWSANNPYDAALVLGHPIGARNAGTHTLDLSSLYSNQKGYDLITTNGTLTINKAQATVTANSGTITYNGTEQSVDGFTIDGLVNGEDQSVLTGVTTSGGKGTNAGSYTLIASGSDGNYELTFVDGALTINKADLTVTAQDASKIYDGLAYSGGNGVTYSGFVASEDASILDGALLYGGNSQGAVNAGDYTLSVSGLNADNYAINYVDGKLTIDKGVVDLMISAKDAFKVYDGEAWFGGNGIDIEGLAAGETLVDLEGTLVWGGSAQGAVNAGDYTITASGLSSPNYDIHFNHGTLTIGKAPLTIAAQNASKTYDGQAWTGGNGVTYSGFVAGENAGLLSGTLVYDGSAQGAVNAGNYTLSASGLSSNNYNINYVDGTLNIDQAPLTIAAQNASKTYDGLAWSGNNGVSYNGFVNGEDISVLDGTLSWSGTAEGAINAGDYTLSVSGLSADNYAINYVDGTLTIGKGVADLMISAKDAFKVYDGEAWFGGNGIEIEGLAAGETLVDLEGTLVWGGSAQGAVNAGDYTITTSGLSSPNYEIRFNGGTLTIGQAPLTIAAQNASKIYDGLAYTGGNGVNYSGFVAGEDASTLDGTLAYGGSAQGAVNAGDYTLLVSGLSADNYAINYVDGTLTIGKGMVDLMISAKDAFKVYDGEAWFGGNGIDVDGLAAGETQADLDGTLVWGGSAQGAVNAGDYTITASGLTSPNYDIRFNDGTLTIGQAPLTIAAQNASKTYDGLAWASGNGVTYSGFVAGDNARVLRGTLTYGGSAQGAVNAGNYTLSASGLNADNYDINFVDGTLTIDKANLTATVQDAQWVQDGSSWSGGNGIRYEGFIEGEDSSALKGELLWGGSAQGAEMPGEYNLSASGLSANNYQLTFIDGQLRIISSTEANGQPYLNAVQQASLPIAAYPQPSISLATSYQPRLFKLQGSVIKLPEF